MIPPCLRIGDVLFPAVRHAAAGRLRDAGWTQAEIAELLGISQGMVSKYLRSERPAVPDDMVWLVDAMAEGIARGTDASAEGAADGDGDPWCRAMAEWAEGADGDDASGTRRLFQDIADVLDRCAAEVPAVLVPAVNINVAGSLPGATDDDDVVAFPGRLARVDGRLRSFGPPTRGASHHLAALLRRLSVLGSEARFVVNLRNAPEVRDALVACGEELVVMDTDVRDGAGVARLDDEQVRGRAAFALLDEGGLGIEPVSYLVDADAGALSERLVRLSRKLARTV